MQAPATPPSRPAGFVANTAWIGILLFGLLTLKTLGWYVELVQDSLLRGLRADSATPVAAQLLAFALDRTHLLLLAQVLLAAFGLATAVGLLQRREWARRAFIALLLLGALALLVGCAGLFALLYGEPMYCRSRDPDCHRDLEQLALGVLVVAALATAGACFGVARLVKRLASAPVRQLMRTATPC